MKQVTQILKSGEINTKEVPVPSLTDKFVLVKNTASVISAGTEKTKIDMGKKNLIQKARARPDLVKQVINKIKSEGFKKTFTTVNSRLNSLSPLGYSSAGSVIAVGGMVEGIQPGDRVACGGAGYANHADIVAIPKNLIVKVPDNVTDEQASFATVGSIALQGVRLAEPLLGETFLVVGLGLLGQITVQLLKANGCNVIATDLDADLVRKAEAYGAIGMIHGGNPVEFTRSMTSGYGVDGVIICAGSSSNQIIEMSGDVTREKGRVVVVGAVRMDIPRESFFKKEISVVISRSYGPGRYDPFYEESGNDYPLGYVRFTEQRNMSTFLDLVSQGRVNVDSLISHRFDLEQADIAYQLIEGKKTEPYLGIILTYGGQTADLARSEKIRVKQSPIEKDKVSISLYGAGNYATASLLPVLAKQEKLTFNGLATASGRTAQGVAEQFGFQFCTSEFGELLENNTDVIMVNTRHDTHAQAVIKALSSNKSVYVEKPLAMSIEELASIHDSYEISQGASVMVGFNRRFAPATRTVLDHFSNTNSPLVINIRVNAGYIPSDHWIQDPVVGGGRLIGEGCHFIDLASALSKSNVVSVFAYGSGRSDKSPLLNDNVCINLKMSDGSIANIIYTADGAKGQSKEYIEVFGGGLSAEIYDFKSVKLFKDSSVLDEIKTPAQDKGQSTMLTEWVDSLKGSVACIDYQCLMHTSIATVLAVESMATGCAMNANLSLLEYSE